jgi:chromosome segregation ATPase
MAPRVPTSAVDDPLRGYHEEIRTLRQSVAGITVIRDQLQADLSALTATRHELEELLLTRDALLSKHELELAARQAEIDMLRKGLAAATTSRDQLQADLSALSGKLQELEQPALEAEVQPATPDLALAERDRRIADLTEQLAARAEQHFLASAERDDLQARLERARVDLSNIAQRRERQTSAQADAEREHARREAALARSHDDLTELQRRVGGHREALQRAEARRQVFESMLRDREQMLDERDAQARALQDELNDLRRAHAEALERANVQLAAALERSESERHFGESYSGTSAPVEGPPAVVPSPAQPDAQSLEAPLAAELADMHATVLAMREQLASEQAANAALREDLAAAELKIREAASNIRHSNAQFDAHAVTAAPALSTGRRLLVRTEGEAGIVHVLGRRTTIGRIPGNDLCIDAEAISRHHALVLVTETGTVVEDLNSTNGVFVNDVRVTRRELHEGDLLTIGKTRFRYVLKPDADPV